MRYCEKTVLIESVYIDYGSGQYEKLRIRHAVEGRFFLRPNDEKLLEIELSEDEITSVIEKYELEQCFFILRVSYRDVHNKVRETTRALGGSGGGHGTFIVQRGETLTED